MSTDRTNRRTFDREAAALSALAHPVRLRVYLDLLAAEPDGKPSGDIASATGVPATTMSAHLAVLTRAGLLAAERRGRTVLYRALRARADGLAELLTGSRGRG